MNRPSIPFCYFSYVLIPALALASPQLSVVETDDALVISQDSQTILRYNKSVQHGPEGTDPVYARSGYIHPVFTPSGQVASGDFSIDHPHQRGIFMAGTNTTFRGEKADFWNLHQKLGRTEHAKTLSVGSSNKTVSFTVALRHVATPNQTDTIVLNEVWKVTAYQTSGDHFLFDVESDQELASNHPLVFNEYHYGGMALRGSNLWTPTEANPTGTCAFLTSDGYERIEGNHTHPRWVSMKGIIDGKAASITVLCHPENFRFPQAVRIHPKMPYFTFAPMFDGSFSLQPGSAYISRYRYLITASDPAPEWIESQWKAYIQ